MIIRWHGGVRIDTDLARALTTSATADNRRLGYVPLPESLRPKVTAAIAALGR
jgi:hypothetical protein